MIAVITDTHLKQGNEDQVYDIFKQAIKVCQDRGIKQLFHAGDFFTSRASQSHSVMDKAMDIFNLFNQEEIGLTIIPGNHDRTDLESEKSFLDVFKVYRNIRLIKASEAIYVEELGWIHMLGYFKESGSYSTRLANFIAHNHEKTILITHIAISGVKNNDGSIVTNDLQPNLFKKYDLVLTGHYHFRNQLASNIWYIGSSHPQNFGEDNDKGICIVNKDLSLEFVNLNFPKYFTYRFDCKDIKQITSQLKQVNHEYDKIRFVITGNETEIENFNRSIFDSYNVDVKFEKTYSKKIVELKKYKEDDIMLSFKQFCLDKNIEDNIRTKSLNYLEKVL